MPGVPRPAERRFQRPRRTRTRRRRPTARSRRGCRAVRAEVSCRSGTRRATSVRLLLSEQFLAARHGQRPVEPHPQHPKVDTARHLLPDGGGDIDASHIKDVKDVLSPAFVLAFPSALFKSREEGYLQDRSTATPECSGRSVWHLWGQLPTARTLVHFMPSGAGGATGENAATAPLPINLAVSQPG